MSAHQKLINKILAWQPVLLGIIHHWVDEDFETEVLGGSEYAMTAAERYEFIKNRTYSTHPPHSRVG